MSEKQSSLARVCSECGAQAHGLMALLFLPDGWTRQDGRVLCPRCSEMGESD